MNGPACHVPPVDACPGNWVPLFHRRRVPFVVERGTRGQAARGGTLGPLLLAEFASIAHGGVPGPERGSALILVSASVNAARQGQRAGR